MIELRDVTKAFPTQNGMRHVLTGVNLTVQHEEFVAVVGASGSGKSTLLNILGCMDQPTSGTYRLAGDVISELTDRELSAVRASRIGFVFQLFHLLPRLTILDNVLLPLQYATNYPPDALSRARTLLARVGLQGREHDRPSILSGGQQQRVAIARALVNGSALILADEPTGNLDPESAAGILALLRDLATQGRTVVIVTHDERVASAAPRRLHVHDGTVTEGS